MPSAQGVQLDSRAQNLVDTIVLRRRECQAEDALRRPAPVTRADLGDTMAFFTVAPTSLVQRYPLDPPIDCTAVPKDANHLRRRAKARRALVERSA